jgi:hypothetical protein
MGSDGRRKRRAVLSELGTMEVRFRVSEAEHQELVALAERQYRTITLEARKAVIEHLQRERDAVPAKA